MPALLIIAAFIAVPLAELAVIIEVGRAIGVGPTIAVLLVDSILGAVLLRAQGRATWIRFNQTVRAGRMPHREALDGALVIFGGALLLTPGFLTDVLGLVLLVPPTRSVARRVVGGLIARRMLAGVGGRAAAPPGSARRGRGAASGDGAGSEARRAHDVDGTATEASGGRSPRESRSTHRGGMGGYPE